jgi:quercetin dioxygenase-like cupin family protein
VSDRFEDHRGVIQDLLGPIDSVTQIFSKEGAVRGNHVHNHTTQWVYVVSGNMLVVWKPGDSIKERNIRTGDFICEEAGVPHAWKAVEDTTVLVFTKGPRSGEAYESDTIRLEEPLL